MSTTVDNLIVNVTANTAPALAGLAKVQASVTTLGASAVAAAGMMGKALTAGLTLPIIGIGVASIKAFGNFDEAMTNSLAIMSGVGPAMRKEMEKTARDIAKVTTISATEAAEAYFFLASAGMDAEQSIAALPVVAKFAQAGNFDMSKATDLATDALSAMGLASGTAEENLANLTRTTDVLIRANTLANATAEQFSTALVTKSAAAAKTLGISLEETVAVLAAMADQGIKGAQAGTQLAMTLNNLGANAVKNSVEFERLGITIFDSAGEMLPLADVVDNLTNGLSGMSDMQKIASISAMGFGDRAAGLIKTLLGTGDAIREYQGELENATGFTDQVAAKQLESFHAQWDLLKSKFVDISLTIGSVLIPKLIELFDAVSPFVEQMAVWIEANSELTVQLMGLAAAIGPALLGFKLLIGIIGIIASPIALIVVAIAAIGYAAYKMGVSFEDVQAVVAGVVAKIEKWLLIMKWKFFANKDEINAIMEDLKAKFIAIWDSILAFVMPIVDMLFGWLMTEIGKFADWWGQVWPDVWKVIKVVMDLIKTAWLIFWPILKAAVMPVIEAIITILSGAFAVIRGIFQTFFAIITGNWEGAWTGLVRIFNGVVGIILGVVEIFTVAIWTAFNLMAGKILGTWDTLWSAIKAGLAGAFNFIVGAIASHLQSIVNTFISGINSAIAVANKIPGIDVNLVPQSNFSLPSVGFGDVSTPTPRVNPMSRFTNSDFMASSTGTKTPHVTPNVKVYIGNEEFSNHVLSSSTLSGEIIRLRRLQ